MNINTQKLVMGSVLLYNLQKVKKILPSSSTNNYS